MSKEVSFVGIQERLPIGKSILFSFQHLFTMFGATVMVPFLTGLSPSIALLGSGIGTLLFILVTKGMVPAYLGSSFAFITPISLALANHANPTTAMVGCFVAGMIFLIVGILTKLIGYKFIMQLLPPIVVGPVIIIIGLELAPVALQMASGYSKFQHIDWTYVLIAIITLITTMIVNIYIKGFLSLIPIILGIGAGYIVSLGFGIVDIGQIVDARYLSMPKSFFVTNWNFSEVQWQVAFSVSLAAFVVIAEHIGHQLVLGKIVHVDMLKKPGLHRSLGGDGIATMVASFLGAPPSTTYGENIGVLAITRVFSTWVIGGAAILAIFLAFLGKVSAVIQAIPLPVMGGVSILLFGMIASSGLRMMIEEKIDLAKKKNLIIVSVILISGIGGHSIGLAGTAVATMVGILLNLILKR